MTTRQLRLLGALAIASYGIHATSALAKEQCGKTGYIKAIMQNYWAFPSYGHIGIVVQYDDGTVTNFYTGDWREVYDNPEARSLLQIASMAYASQSPVAVMVNDTCKNTTKLDDNRTWVIEWSGLAVGKFPDSSQRKQD